MTAAHGPSGSNHFTRMMAAARVWLKNALFPRVLVHNSTRLLYRDPVPAGRGGKLSHAGFVRFASSFVCGPSATPITFYNRDSHRRTDGKLIFVTHSRDPQWTGETPSRPRLRRDSAARRTATTTTIRFLHNRSGKAPSPPRFSSARHSAPYRPTRTSHSPHSRSTPPRAPSGRTTSPRRKSRSRVPPPLPTATPPRSETCRKRLIA